MVKPFRLFIVLLLLLAVLAVTSLFLPKDGFRIGSYHLKYPTFLELFDLDSIDRPADFSLHPELALLDRLMDSIVADKEIDTTIFIVAHDTSELLDSIAELEDDSLRILEREKTRDTQITADVLKGRLVPLEMADSGFAALEYFFRALATGQTSKKQIRVMHYGDSQIEGDRITSFLRSRLQARFGGRGVGFLHAVPHSYQPGAVNQTISGNWQQTLLPDLGRGALEHRFGILGGYSTFHSSRRAPRGGFTEAWIRFQRRGSQQSNARNFTRCRVFYGYAKEPFMLSITYGDKTQDAEMIPPSSSINQISWNIPLAHNTIQIDFKGDVSPLVYGISLESPTGVVVDNIAIRGSSGNDFTRADDQSLKRVMQLVDPSLIILQFGVNVVPHIVESYLYYENQMYQQVLALRRAKPNVSVIIVGVSDMSRREGGRFVSYPNIEKIRDAQRNAALRSGAAFWDCYMAMGGQNSMPAWVYATPALASKDFVHFTLRGSNLIAEMFYSSLMNSYEEYISSQSK